LVSFKLQRTNDVAKHHFADILQLLLQSRVKDKQRKQRMSYSWIDTTRVWSKIWVMAARAGRPL